MITEDGSHWIEADDAEVTICIAGQPGNWIVKLKRGKTILACAALASLEEAVTDAIESSAKLVRLQDRFRYPSARGM